MKRRVRILHPNKKDIYKELEKIDVDKYALDIFNNKSKINLIKIKNLKIEEANILKQDALSVGADTAIPRSSISGNPNITDVILFATNRELEKLKVKLKKQPFSLDNLYSEIEFALKDNPKYFEFNNKKLSLKKPKIMGILNITPDSFYDGGKYSKEEQIKNRVKNMIDEGVDIIDLGAESTRPGSERVALHEELERLLPAVEIIKNINGDIPLSIDTYKSKVAEKMLRAGADIINDISGFTFDENMPEVVSKYNAGIIIMHIKGTPKNMQKNPYYEDVIEEIYDYFIHKINIAEKNGIGHSHIAVDPGIGFGKRLEDNLEIIRRLKEFKSLGFPLLMGLSRKSFLKPLTGRKVDRRLAGTIAANTISLLNGANILRVHDIKETRDLINTFEGINYEN
ncbi:MAG: dihydropteroate synthase [Candidatus Mcinerneyibacterium aminivorans]|uniref:Dihydropteroate synthase n=1 Tax=Candidatus Mcinerneyibacterium aminivorans TaxID=2703815 RepID=A0A5D0MG42_9BACT|nr:MAG: dihydropteroate synthase [Candidatus Mcinerneyibacterium aminivorans]